MVFFVYRMVAPMCCIVLIVIFCFIIQEKKKKRKGTKRKSEFCWAMHLRRPQVLRFIAHEHLGWQAAVYLDGLHCSTSKVQKHY